MADTDPTSLTLRDGTPIELKRDQILAFGNDPLMAECKGSMSAVIEPADFGDDDDKPDE